MQRHETESTVGEPSDQWYDFRGASTGTDVECEGWRQEAALRLLNNNLDPEVAERPEDLADDRGTLREGAPADLAVLSTRTHVYLAYNVGEIPVETVLKGGEVVHAG
jgi:predicted amidohydrolase YtcJ